MTKMPLEAAFMTRTGQNYQAMKRRFGERRIKTGKRAGRVVQVGREIPFTLEAFRNWLFAKLGGYNGTVKCRYCPVILDAMNVGFEHVHPVSQGGSLSLDNLDCCCDRCNRLKGKLTERTFLALKRWMETAGTSPEAPTLADVVDVEKRLRGGGTFYKTKVEKKKAAAVAAEQLEVF